VEHRPVIPRYLPADPAIPMMCWQCRVPRAFRTGHVSPPPESSAVRCLQCGEPTWLACVDCGEPYEPLKGIHLPRLAEPG
jgi:hypothetical protein